MALNERLRNATLSIEHWGVGFIFINGGSVYVRATDVDDPMTLSWALASDIRPSEIRLYVDHLCWLCCDLSSDLRSKGWG